MEVIGQVLTISPVWQGVQHVVFLSACLLIALLAWKRGSLSAGAGIGAFLLAAGLYLTGGLLLLFLLMVFFFSSTFLTRFKATVKDPVESGIHAKTGPRDLAQVAANGGAALLMSILFALTRNQAYLIAGVSALAASNADTWASEIGILSRNPPVSLLTFRPVRRGISGGVSLLGFAASLGGALLIALAYAFYAIVMGQIRSALVWQLLLILLAGFVGSLLDSLLGATLQAKYISRETGELTEKPCQNGRANQLRSGWRFVNNDFVNFASSLLSSLLILLVVGAQL